MNIVCRESGKSESGKAEPDVARERTESPERIVTCARCGNRIASTDDFIKPGDEDYSIFQNPAGIFFRIVCFRKTDGCIVDGDYTDYNSWFSGYLWSVAFCSRCTSHLGWHYISGSSSFWGLIADRLTGV